MSASAGESIFRPSGLRAGGRRVSGAPSMCSLVQCAGRRLFARMDGIRLIWALSPILLRSLAATALKSGPAQKPKGAHGTRTDFDDAASAGVGTSASRDRQPVAAASEGHMMGSSCARAMADDAGFSPSPPASSSAPYEPPRTGTWVDLLPGSSEDVIIVLDAKAFMRYQSPHRERLLGIRPGDLTGVQAIDLVNLGRTMLQRLPSNTSERGSTGPSSVSFKRSTSTWWPKESKRRQR